MGTAIAFYLLAALILVGAVLVVTAKSAVHSVVWLVGTIVSVAALYVVQHAEFLAVIQILVYAGGIVVLYLFVVMLVNLKRPAEALVHAQRRDRWALVLAGALLAQFAAVAFYAFDTPAGPATVVSSARGNVVDVARALYVEYLVPFEVASVLLLVAMIGAIVLARRDA